MRTTHVGSLPRSQEIIDIIFAKERGDLIDQEKFNAILSREVALCVARQESVGLDVISDGELSKISYATYIKDRYTGFAGDSPRNPPADLKRFPEFLRKLAQSGGTPSYARPRCVAEIVPKPGNTELITDIAHLKNGLAAHGRLEGFMNAASPGVIALFLPNEYYTSQETYLNAIADALAQEYKAITEAGLYLQIDAPDLALSRHMLYENKSDEEFVELIRLQTAALCRALNGIDPRRTRLHVCWGNYEGPHICDIGIDKLFDTLMELPCVYLLFENSNPRHAHEWKVFMERKNDIPKDKILVPGVIDSTTNYVEHPKLVAERLERFALIVGEDRVIAGSDCGFSTFAGFGAVDADIAYCKLENLRAGVDLLLGR